ncbi:MAG: hypothetical protein ACK5P6_00105 [Pseudobdellovibrionaceae bacterium]
MEYLVSELGKLGMKIVPLPNDTRRSKLDWLFIRGCTVKKAEILFDVESSDHLPLSADLRHP